MEISDDLLDRLIAALESSYMTYDDQGYETMDNDLYDLLQELRALRS